MTADPSHAEQANPWFARTDADAPPAVPHPRTPLDDEPAATVGAPILSGGLPGAGAPGGAAAGGPAVGGPAAGGGAVGGGAVGGGAVGGGAVGGGSGGAAGALVAFAVARLADGRRPEQAFCDLVALGTERRLAAIAVCAAAGTPWDDAETRMASFDDIWVSLAGASAESAGSLLELYGYFDHEVELTPQEAEIAGALRRAMAAVEYLPSGYANQMYRLLRTGKLREALFSLEEMGAQRWPDRLPFWLELTEAAVKLDAAAILDTEIAAVRRRCESRTLR